MNYRWRKWIAGAFSRSSASPWAALPYVRSRDAPSASAASAQRFALPLIADDRGALDAGGLISLTASSEELDRQVASFVDRILRGAKPGDLPIERPTRFEIVVNLKAARALGITVPQSVLLRQRDHPVSATPLRFR